MHTQSLHKHTAATFDHLRLDGISRSFGDRRVLTNVGFSVPRGARIGLIGENGAGKSTLLRIIAGVDEPDSGTVARSARTGLLWQEVPRDADDTVDDLIERALVEFRLAEHELTDAAEKLGSSASDSERYAAALENAERLDVWAIDARRDRVLAGLGLDSIPRQRRLDAVSGGQRSRFALAALLLERPDALLLDEPTNHLDDSAVSFLRDELTGWNGPVLFASHDRAFLDEAATALIDLDAGRSGRGESHGVTVFGGSFTEYLDAKQAERERWEQQFAAEQDELKQLKLTVDVTARHVNHGRGPTDNDKFITKFKRARTDGAISRRVKDARGRLDDLRENHVRKPPTLLSFTGIPTGSHARGEGTALLAVRDVCIRGRLRADRVTIEPQTQLLVTGPNGAGKSTLLHVMAGDLRPDRGNVARRRGLRVQLLEQDVRFAKPDASARQLYEKALGEKRAGQVPLTSLGLVAPRDADRPVGSLSVGQQRRVALALIIAKPPHLFLLDEPTNHLSLSLATELEHALGSYPGAVVIASHDRWLRRRWNEEEFALTAE
ncbi:ABC-F family ATP-binding cassette domain-containing protein [Paramicrobacterium chengjingii]|uniref:ABC-F family ATP-binding cassette domain-containing protein n=1 Tax=Paramicrobacterium chengjingii TaxID=2769067 RepID=A0ABX6YKS0_9MICO|nr:ABC-F family ATP-binding cassette domain-containing protein [Microbacterium chengjingii]QPZ39320.1 ABC-F family ATP-binding cassette domain-containing protein [Microbacterium chengjingii]